MIPRAAIGLIVLVLAGPAWAAGPRIAFETETVQAGEVVRGEEVQAEFVYRNEGDAPLRILKAKPG